MNKFQIGDKVIVTAHKEDMEYPCISAKKDLFNLVGTICGVWYQLGQWKYVL